MSEGSSSKGAETFEKHKADIESVDTEQDVFNELEKSLQIPFLTKEGESSKQSILQDVWEGTPPASNDPEAVKKHREKQEKYQTELRTSLIHVKTAQELTVLGLKVSPEDKKALEKRFERNIFSVKEARRMTLTTILKGMRKTYGDKESRFLEIESNKTDGDTLTRVRKIEEDVWEPLDPTEKGNPERNPLYTSDGLPNFVAISERMQFLLQILYKDPAKEKEQGIDPDAPEEERKATRERVQKLLYGLQMIKEMNPVVARLYDAKKALGPGLLVKPAKFALFSAAVVLGILSLIPVVKKIIHGENLEAADWPAAAWPAIVVYMGKFLPKGSAGQIETIRDVGTKLFANKPFWTVTEAMGGKDAAIKAVKEAHTLLESEDKKELLKNMIKEGKTKISEGELREFTDKKDDSKLWTALKNKTIGEDHGDEYRYTFFKTLSNLNLHKIGVKDATLAQINIHYS